MERSGHADILFIEHVYRWTNRHVQLQQIQKQLSSVRYVHNVHVYCAVCVMCAINCYSSRDHPLRVGLNYIIIIIELRPNGTDFKYTILGRLRCSYVLPSLNKASTSCISHLWYATERDRVHKNRYEASGIDTLSNSGARGWTSFKRNILYAIRSLKINGVEINR